MTVVNKKNVLITGAAHGIGKLMAEMIADLGGNLILCDVNENGLKETADIVRKKGVSANVYVLDISDRDAVYKTAERVHKEIGPVHVLINNAAIVYTGEILDLPDDKHKKHVDVNLLGTLWMIKAFVPDMVKRNEGHIVNIASSAGLIAIPGMGIYSATKFAMMGLNEALRFELGNKKSKVKTLVICPYIIKTGMFEGMKAPFFMPALEPEAMAKAVIKGILRDRKFIGKPWTVYLPSIVKAFYPISLLDASIRSIGIHKSVYSCKGFYKP
jgi:all-trans-retinol dehydrogenase (NAD+)